MLGENSARLYQSFFSPAELHKGAEGKLLAEANSASGF